jgi:hypothetical protein
LMKKHELSAMVARFMETAWIRWFKLYFSRQRKSHSSAHSQSPGVSLVLGVWCGFFFSLYQKACKFISETIWHVRFREDYERK